MSDIDELARANLRTEAALEISGAICDMVPDLWMRDLVVSDIVECWLALGPEVQDAYANDGRGSGLAAFAGSYIDEIDQIWTSDLPAANSENINEALCRGGWANHIMLIQRRAATGEPLDLAWLERFSSPSTH